MQYVLMVIDGLLGTMRKGYTGDLNEDVFRLCTESTRTKIGVQSMKIVKQWDRKTTKTKLNVVVELD